MELSGCKSECIFSRVHRLYVITSRSKSIEGRKTKGIDDPRLYARGIVSQEHPRGETSDDDDMRERDTGGDSDEMSMDGTRGWKDGTTVYYPAWCKTEHAIVPSKDRAQERRGIA